MAGAVRGGAGVKLDYGAIGDFIDSHEELTEKQASQLLDRVLGFLATILQDYLDANDDVPREPLTTLIAAFRSGQPVASSTLADYARRFDEIMFDADDTDRWYDVTTQDTLLLLLDVATSRLSVGGLLVQALDPVAKITFALHDDGLHDPDFSTVEGAVHFLLEADAASRDAKAAALMAMLGDRPAHL